MKGKNPYFWELHIVCSQWTLAKYSNMFRWDSLDDLSRIRATLKENLIHQAKPVNVPKSISLIFESLYSN